jgi:hypothetical protein
MGILRDRMIEEMKLRNFSPATHTFPRSRQRTGTQKRNFRGGAGITPDICYSTK